MEKAEKLMLKDRAMLDHYLSATVLGNPEATMKADRYIYESFTKKGKRRRVRKGLVESVESAFSEMSPDLVCGYFSILLQSLKEEGKEEYAGKLEGFSEEGAHIGHLVKTHHILELTYLNDKWEKTTAYASSP